MPIALEAIEKFMKEQMDDSELIATQSKVSILNIQKYFEKLENNEIPPPIKVKESMIIEGHHRYIAGRLFSKLPDIIPGEAPRCIEKYKWKDMILDANQWPERKLI